MAWTLCTKEDVTLIHPIQESELEDMWSDIVEALIRQHMGQPNLGLTGTVIVNELHNGTGTPMIQVYKPPILSVQAIRLSDLDGTGLAASDFVVFPSGYIQLKYQDFPEGNLNIGLDYTSGSDSVDDVTRLTAVAMVIAIINYRRRGGADSSIKWGTADKKAGEPTPNQEIGLTTHLQMIMKQLLRRPRARVR